MVLEMVQPTITVQNCNLSVQENDKEDDDSFELDDNEDKEETHQVSTKALVNLKVKTEMLSTLAKNAMKNWERDILDLVNIDISKY